MSVCDKSDASPVTTRLLRPIPFPSSGQHHSAASPTATPQASPSADAARALLAGARRSAPMQHARHFLTKAAASASPRSQAPPSTTGGQGPAQSNPIANETGRGRRMAPPTGFQLSLWPGSRLVPASSGPEAPHGVDFPTRRKSWTRHSPQRVDEAP